MSAPAEAVDAPPSIDGLESRVVDVETRDVGRLRVHMAEGGTGEPVLMLHGWPQHFWCWRSVAPTLAGRYRVICPDLRGFGWSDAPGSGYHPETFASDAIALLDALGIERVRLIGHDWGGFTGFLLCLRHPERISAFLALNAPPPWARPSPRTLLELRHVWYTWVNAVPLLGAALPRFQPDWIPWLIDHWSMRDGIDPTAAAIYARRLADPARAHATTLLYRAYQRVAADTTLRRRWDALRLTVPTRLLLGAGDPAIPRAFAEGWERHADAPAELEIVEDCGHFAPEEQPDLVVARALAHFSAAV